MTSRNLRISLTVTASCEPVDFRPLFGRDSPDSCCRRPKGGSDERLGVIGMSGSQE